MPARRQPTELLLLKGSFKNRPRSRLEARAGEPEVETALGPPPEHLNARAKMIWQRLAHDAFWLRVTHRDVLEVLCVYKAEFERNPLEMSAAQVAQMMRASIELGLTAIAQTRIDARERPKPEDNPFAQFQ